MRVYLEQIANQEIQARCCAMFSRSHKPLDEQLAKATAEQAEEFARKYVVGYGHNSINDCGAICAAIERVSMIAAKFVEDYPLFNGQESSTRYIPFDTGEFSEMVESPFPEGDDRTYIQRELMDFYRRAIPVQRAFIAKENSIDDLDSESAPVQRSVSAKSFDILRGFLPAGCRTQLAWVTTFRQAAERIEMMIRHPLAEVRQLGRQLADSCTAMYPGAFSGLEKDSYAAAADEYYTDDFWQAYHMPYLGGSPDIHVEVNGNFKNCGEWANRHQSKKLPMREALMNGRVVITAAIDYGSWRDIHRHRNCSQVFPLLEAVEFEPFYMDNLAPELQDEAVDLIEFQTRQICSERDYITQYAVPMGFKCMYVAEWSLPQLVYVLELRSKPTVHPTVRKLIKTIYDAVKNEPGFPKVSCDFSDYPYTRRINLQRGKES